VLPIADNLKIIEKIESGVTIAKLAADRGISVTTVKEIMKNKESIRKFAMKFYVDTRAGKKQGKREKHIGKH
jgi:predicted transcriptional regulator